ncbi:non-reducing polyketide synthase encA [Aspergillus novofumigatus IBT 16806]|uniref:Putative polyketide synthase n=1 Tax=Aspergillus novofumigatus (strain IBT 16806) TaxID=1392255 RepID=A0A2I1BU36_ASPN1|nr:putative polyketide synthase [Aspergillus novofumigatus IBT 16806]PKX88913.1 putative polyketide synthase [Aspergillus novofumigatus IBT 16806]
MQGPSRLALFHFANGFPPEDIQDLFRRLRSQSKTESGWTLRAFVVQATNALREEIRELPDHLRNPLTPLDSALDLAALPDWRRGPLAGALEGVLLCLIEIGSLIAHYERTPDQFKFSARTACFTGIGTGLLAAAAAAASLTLADLPRLGAAAVRIALRMGVVVAETSQSVEAREPDAPADSWAAVVMGLDEDTVREELDLFNASTHNPVPSRLFISAGGTGNVTISGPPSELRQVFRVSEKLRSARYAHLPVYGGLCHAPHLYNSCHWTWIMEPINDAAFDQIMVDAAPLFPPGDDAPFEASTPRELFESVVCDLLMGMIRWNRAVDGVLDSLGHTLPSECHVYAFRPCAVVADIVASGQVKVPHCQFQTHDLLDWTCQSGTGSGPTGREDSSIAIVGMACRFPGGANDLNLFWDLLEQGMDVHQKIPTDRYDVESHTDMSGKSRNTSLTPFGCFIDQPGLFDAGFFDMSPREAMQTDPMHRLALMTAYEALEQAGFVPNRTEATHLKRIGTFYGQSCDDYREANAGQEVDTYYIPGGCRAFAPGRINYFFKFSGPSFDCDTACSSSLATIQMACTFLLHRDTNMAVAGGLNILTNSDGFAGLSRGHFLSKTGGCKTFDCNADGYCRADGIGSIVLKRLDDAQRDNDHIFGVILASATNHSARAISITHPHAPSQAELYRDILNRAGVSPMDVDFIEMHGTGTQAGDLTEMESVTSVFSPGVPKRNQPLYIGSVKANVGHGEAAAGVMALIKVLLVLQRQAIPKHVGIKTSLNPRFPDLDRLNVRIPYEQVPWPRSPTRKRYALVNNFSAAGGNTSLLIEEPPVRPEPEADPRTAFIVAISAKSKASLKNNLQSFLAYLESRPSINLAHLSYTTTARRMHHNHRVAVHGSTQSSIMQELNKYLPAVHTHRPVPNMPPSIAFVFSGQGSFYTGIARQLYEHHPGFRLQITRLHVICLSHGFPSFRRAITGDLSDNGSEAEPIITHLTIVCVSIALCRLWETLGVKPCVVAGASLGEFAALYAAGVLSASDAIYLVGRRALLLQELCTPNTHAMLAVRASVEQISDVLGGQPYEVACINGSSDITLSCSSAEIINIQLAIEQRGYKCTRLDVPFAFHSTQMDPLLGPFAQISRGVTFKAPNIPVISPSLGDCVFDGKTINPSYMSNVTRNPVKFVDALEAARGMDLVDAKTVWVEVGPHASYSRFVGSAMPPGTATIASLNSNEDNWCTFARNLGQLHNLGVDLNWHEWHAPFESDLRLLIDLPAYQWNTKNYWIQYNGDWMLRKDGKPSPLSSSSANHRLQSIPPALGTSLVHRLVYESVQDNRAEVIVESDIQHPDFFEAMNGHRMNGCAVATTAIHADIAFTLAKYLSSSIMPNSTVALDINVKNMQVQHGLVARKDRSRPQLIQVRGIADVARGLVHLSWHLVDEHGHRVEESFATAVAEYGDHEAWLEEWSPVAHLVVSRIDVLQRLADEGTASRLSRDMVYMLFNNLVDYAEKYRGMQMVVLHGLEAMANVTLAAPEQSGGKWTVAPHYIDSVAHLAGFILNGGNALDPRRNFYVTPGWKSMRFTRPLVPGVRYQSYVKMMPIREQPGFYAGDVYILHEGQIVGLVGGITFRTPPDTTTNAVIQAGRVHHPMFSESMHALRVGPAGQESAVLSETLSRQGHRLSRTVMDSSDSSPVTTLTPLTLRPVAASTERPIVHRAMAMIAAETAIELTELSDETAFSSIGVDSLLSLVLAEKFTAEFRLEFRSSLFLDCPTIGDLKAWLIDYC